MDDLVKGLCPLDTLTVWPLLLTKRSVLHRRNHDYRSGDETTQPDI